MKIKNLLFALSLFAGATAFAQAPEKFNYQAVVRDANNTLITNSTIGVKISILQGSSSGNIVYSETQNPNTNLNGLFNVEIGAGTVGAGDISQIDWVANSYFIKTEIDLAGGTNYTPALARLLPSEYYL